MVAVDLPVRREFSYAIPPGFPRDLQGRRVAVRLANRVRTGVVVGVRFGRPDPGLDLRPLRQLLDPEPLFDEAALRFLSAFADRRLLPLGQMVFASLPAALRLPRPFRADLSYRISERPSLDILQRPDRNALGKFGPDGFLGTEALSRLSPRMRQRIRDLAQTGILREEIDLSGAFPAGPRAGPAPRLAGWAARIAERIAGAAGGGFGAHLCCVPPGEERTGICLRLVDRALRQREQVLVLAPEVSRADALASALGSRLGRRIAVSHAGIPGHRRAMGWLGAARGAVDVLVGTRSAALAPMPRLGLVVVDDAHDPGLAQDEAPRHGACDLARVRCELAGARLVLCTPTPALEDYRESRDGTGPVTLHTAPRAKARAGRTRVVIEDVRGKQMFHGVSAPLVARLKREAGRGGAAMVLVDRRGWARRVFCQRCGDVPACEECGVALSAHRRERELRCHLCGRARPLPDGCGHCGAKTVALLGEGTEQVEEGLRKAIPAARVVRWDSDAAADAGHPREIEEAEEAIRRGAADIVVGTRLAARLKDMDNLRRIVVTDADTLLASPDFRSTERLLARLVGISHWPRESASSPVLNVQTRFPGHDLLKALATNDVLGHMDRLLDERRRAGLPPYAALGVVRGWGNSKERVVRALSAARERLAAALAGKDGVRLLGVVPSHLRHRPGIHRLHFALRADDEASVREALTVAGEVVGDRIDGVRIEREIVPRRL